MKKRGALKNRSIMLGVCLCLAATALTMVILNENYIQSIRKLVRSTTASNITELTVNKAQFLDERIRTEHLSLKSLASSIGAGTDISTHKELLREYQELHGATCMWIFDTQGSGFCTSPEESTDLPAEWQESFAGALRGESDTLELFVGRLGRRQVLFQTPVYRGGQAVGVLYESYPVQLLQNTYGGTTYNDAGYSYVLGADGSIILAPVRFSFAQINSSFQAVLASGENSPEAVKTFMDALQDGVKGTATFDFEGEMQFLSFVPLAEKEGWYLVTVIPLSLVEKDGTVIVSLAIRMGVIFALVVLFALAVALTAVYYRSKKRRENDLYIRSVYQAISENIDTVIFIVDGKNDAVEYAFENALEVLGIPAYAFTVPTGGEESEFQGQIRRMLREKPGNKTVQARQLYNDLLGQSMWLNVAALPVTLNGVRKYIFAITDVTQDRQIRENLNAALAAAEQANAAKSRFLSNMSHDIRTPMNAIVGMAKLAECHIEDCARVEDCLRKINISAKHLLNLINDVLDMSKIESGKMSLSAEPFSLPELLEGDFAIMQPQCRSKRQTLSLEAEKLRHEFLVGDSLRLNQVFLNLLSNAAKFTPEGGRISFAIEELPQEAAHAGYAVYRFRISDTGIGMAPDFLPHIFSPFERAKTKAVGTIEGTGLGLAISKNIVEAMGGHILVESALGVGTTFTVELELKLQDGTEEEAGIVKALEGLRALIIDDSQSDCELLRTYLAEFGMDAETLRTGVEAVQRCGRVQYDLVLVDWKLPDIDGVETARRIQELAGAAPQMVLITACDYSLVETEAALKGIELILQKPIFKSTLRQKLDKMFSSRESPSGGKMGDILRGRRFLLVEDNDLNREIAVELFELAGAQVETAIDGKLGVEAFVSRAAGSFDAVFMDIQMPVMDGYEATKRIRASGHPQAGDIPIIAMSANVFAEDVRASLEAGMDAHVGKPIDMDEICRVLARLLPSGFAAQNTSQNSGREQ